jgi:hypothetical protein
MCGSDKAPVFRRETAAALAALEFLMQLSL